ncbi:MAG: sulfatase [Luteolibacter sp.]
MKKLLLSVLLPILPVVSMAAEKPNILWIFPEDLSPFMGCYGDEINAGHTPAIDALAADGVLFERAYVTAPVCSASRSAIITGVMQTTTGTHQHRSSRAAKGVVPGEARIYLPEGMQTIPELMKGAGYFTFNAGKDDYNFHYDRRALYDTGTPDKYETGENGWQGNKGINKSGWKTGAWNDRKDKSQPWFGQIELKGGKGGEKYAREGELLPADAVPLPAYFPNIPSIQAMWTRHYNAVRGTDAQVASIIEALKRDGEYENTIIFFFSDHGSNTSLRHKQFCYEGGLHIPLIIAGKHVKLEAGRIIKDLVSSLDISATTLAFGGAEMPGYLEGRDLFADDYEPREFVVSARDRCDFTIDRTRAVTSQQYSYLRNYMPERPMLQPQYRDGNADMKAMRKAHADGTLNEYQEAHWFGERPEEELYDLEADPLQMNNLAENSEYKSMLDQHRKVLAEWTAETDEKGQYPEAAEKLKGTYDLWKKGGTFEKGYVNPEYDVFR